MGGNYVLLATQQTEAAQISNDSPELKSPGFDRVTNLLPQCAQHSSNCHTMVTCFSPLSISLERLFLSLIDISVQNLHISRVIARVFGVILCISSLCDSERLMVIHSRRLRTEREGNTIGSRKLFIYHAYILQTLHSTPLALIG